jgi:hypothetical protein
LAVKEDCPGQRAETEYMQDMIDRFVTWAQLRPDVRAGVVLGSWARDDMPADNLFVKTIVSVSMILVALFSIHSICQAATIRGSVKEIHSGAGKASAANEVTVTLYRGGLGSSDLQKVEAFRTGIDGLYQFENIPKGEYTIHVQDPNVKEPNWGPAAYQRVSVADDNAVIELEPTVIDYK